MLSWIVRLFMMLAAPFAALLVSRYTPKYELVQTFIALVLMVGFIVMAAACTKRDPRAPHDAAKLDSDR
jgi:MFS-type transporter involved in bile tolerance (Atg22 family)